MYSTIYLLVEKNLQGTNRKQFDMASESMDFLIYYLLSLEVFRINFKLVLNFVIEIILKNDKIYHRINSALHGKSLGSKINRLCDYQFHPLFNQALR